VEIPITIKATMPTPDEILTPEEREKLIELAQSVANVSKTVWETQIEDIDRLITAQNRRVDEAKRIADTGNSEIYELELKRMKNLERAKEKQVRKLQALSAIELFANSAIAVSKAAAEGGALAPITIAITLTALLAGLIKARAIASQGFEEGGFTGHGNKHSESTMIGSRPYKYHYEEFVFNEKKTKENFDIFKAVHEGKLNLRNELTKAKMVDGLINGRIKNIPQFVNVSSTEGSIRNEIKELRNDIKKQERLMISISEKGIFLIANRYQQKSEMINKLAR